MELTDMIDFYTTNYTNYTKGYALDNRMIIRVKDFNI